MSGMKKRIPRPVKVPTIINRQARFATVHAVVDKIERGEIDVVVINGKDVPVYHDLVDGGMHELIPAMKGWCAFIEKMCDSTGAAVSLTAHRAIIETLEGGNDIRWPDIPAMRAEIRQHETVYMMTTPEQRASLAKTCQVLFEVEKLGLTRHGEAT